MKMGVTDCLSRGLRKSLSPLVYGRAKYVGAAMNDAPDLVLVTELDEICVGLEEEAGFGVDLLDKLLAMPKRIRVALAKRLMEDV